MATLSAPLKSMNDFMTTKAGKKAVGRVGALQSLLSTVEGLMEAVGMPKDEENVILAELRARALHRAGLTEDDLLAKIEERNKARDAKDFAESDRLRDELSARGVSVSWTVLRCRGVQFQSSTRRRLPSSRGNIHASLQRIDCFLC